MTDTRSEASIKYCQLEWNDTAGYDEEDELSNVSPFDIILHKKELLKWFQVKRRH